MVLLWIKLNPIHPRMLCAKFGWNWLSGSGEEDFFNFVNELSLFRNYLPLEKGRALYLNKLDSPSPEDAVSQVWLEMSQWIWRGRFLKFVNVFLPFRHYLPLENHLWTNLNPLHPGIVWAKFGWNWSSGSREEDGMWKVYNNNDNACQRQQQRKQRLKLTWVFGSGELKMLLTN